MFCNRKNSLYSKKWEVLKLPKDSKLKDVDLHNLDYKKKEYKESIENKVQIAYKKGFEEGIQSIDTNINKINQVEKQNEKLIIEQTKLLKKIEKHIEENTIKISSSIQNECFNIIKHVSEFLLKDELNTSPEKIKNVIKEAFKVINKDMKTYLFLHPENHEKIVEIFNNDNIQVCEDSSLEIWDFYLVQEHTKINGSLKKIIDQATFSILGKT